MNYSLGLASFTVFPCNSLLSESMVASLDEFVNSNNYEICAQEKFVRTSPGQFDQKFSSGSAWVLECLRGQQYHKHRFRESDSLFSLRRILFVANRGLELSFVGDPDGGSSGVGDSVVRERFVARGPIFMEMCFDGRVIHRFRPLDGRLFAYSFHFKDFHALDSTLALQTELFSGDVPPVANEICIGD